MTPDRYVVLGTNDEIHAASLDNLREINEDKQFEQASMEEAKEEVYADTTSSLQLGHLRLDENDNLHKLIATNVAKSMGALVAIVEKD